MKEQSHQLSVGHVPRVWQHSGAEGGPGVAGRDSCPWRAHGLLGGTRVNRTGLRSRLKAGLGTVTQAVPGSLVHVIHAQNGMIFVFVLFW